MSQVIDLLQKMVAIPSVSGEEEDCRDFVAGWLDDHGITPRVIGRNVLAVVEGTAPRSDDGRGLVLCSHYDVVPVGAGWTRDPWDGALEDGCVRGRGSNDAKSSVAAMMVAAASIDRSRLAGRLVLALVCDEETGGEGIEVMLDDLPPADACVVGEPTELDVCRGQRGLLSASIVVSGRSCHASRPWEGDNAITAAARDILAVHELDLGEPDELLGPATLECTVIEGGTRRNVIPGECVIQLDGRPAPTCDNATMVERLRAAVSGEVRVRSDRYVPVVAAPDAEIVRVATAASPTRRVRAFGGVSDLFHLRHIGGVIMGPGTSVASHAPDEWVAVEQVEAAVTAYRTIATSFLASSAPSTTHEEAGA